MTRPEHAANLRRILRLPVGNDPWLTQLRDIGARAAIADLVACGPNGSQQAHSIVAGWLMESERERLRGHVGEARTMGAAWESR